MSVRIQQPLEGYQRGRFPSLLPNEGSSIALATGNAFLNMKEIPFTKEQKYSKREEEIGGLRLGETKKV